MAKIFEIRWHGRGGQGAKTAALLLAEAASVAGKEIQGFPEYGPERTGAPVASFNRISDQPIGIRSAVTHPDVVVVLDPTLIGRVDVTSGLGNGGAIIVNTNGPASQIRTRLKVDGIRVYTVDANQISLDTLGKAIPNTPMMGALMRVSGILDYEDFMLSLRVQLTKKFKGKETIVEGNLRAVERAYQEVQGDDL
ncbi:MAG: 2-oxoacid:acceptor oxidoreductase family protein [Firmicutes bacterium]|nr:2-oxoacid:acceptor oxidoreductase family protein [Bacillota bacterium]